MTTVDPREQSGADRLLATREADRQRLCGVVQRDVAGRVPGRVLVRNADRSQADHRGLEALNNCWRLTLELLQKMGTDQKRT